VTFQDALFGPMGLLAGAFIAIGAFVTGRVITRTHLTDLLKVWEKENDDLRKDRDFWRQLALAGTSLAAKATDLATITKKEAAAS
jgi:hypothetical protein